MGRACMAVSTRKTPQRCGAISAVLTRRPRARSLSTGRAPGALCPRRARSLRPAALTPSRAWRSTGS
eukprot:11224965-Lingulodinium_polyedra.AAC.1